MNFRTIIQAHTKSQYFPWEYKKRAYKTLFDEEVGSVLTSILSQRRILVFLEHILER